MGLVSVIQMPYETLFYILLYVGAKGARRVVCVPVNRNLAERWALTKHKTF
jgi:hypothetical protein